MDMFTGTPHKKNSRLVDQATTLTELLHSDTAYPAGSLVLEAGCGVGPRRSPLQRAVLLQSSSRSISPGNRWLGAAQAIQAEGFRNVTFQLADIFNLPICSRPL